MNQLSKIIFFRNNVLKKVNSDSIANFLNYFQKNLVSTLQIIAPQIDLPVPLNFKKLGTPQIEIADEVLVNSS